MGVSRWRVAALVGLLALYLAAALLLSSVALHEPRPLNSLHSSKLSGINGIGMGMRLGSIGSGRARRSRPRWCRPLRYLTDPKPPVALVSFPGSGNTWLRYLLQQATGIHTGSVYKDYGLLKNGFPAEAVSNGSVLVVKTHEWGTSARASFSRAVLLLRAPEQAIQAEFNRQSGGHVGFASPDRYRRTKGKYWQKFVAEKLVAWRQTNLDWLMNFTGPIHIIYYDDLVANVEETLRKLLKFFNITVDEQMLLCALERREGIYRRKKRLMSFDPFTPNMRNALIEEQDKVYRVIKQNHRLPTPQSTASTR
ncbi:WSCD family member AGAP003962 [Arctopsyche grandis]|uniref:WSCD family member AGAP003962 n=1 Tax=Arctopsyche grandis TaxID=121162 RepID=UPI00406D891C